MTAPSEDSVMRTLILNASPHPDGNSAALARLFLSFLPGEHAILSAYELSVSPCTACGGCAGSGVCVIDDSMRTVWEKLAWADCVAVASPLHFTSLPAPMVAIISRWQSHWHLRRLGIVPNPLSGRRRCGVLLATAGSRYPNMFDCARRVLLAGFNTLGIEMCGVVSVSGMDGDRV
jgi:multimeric flavodoxin WrbA